MKALKVSASRTRAGFTLHEKVHCCQALNVSTTHETSTSRLDWQWPLSGVHSIMMVNPAQPVEGGGCTLSTTSTRVASSPPSPSPAKLAREFYLCVPPCPSPLLSGFYFARKQLDLLLLYISERWFFKRRMYNGLQEAAGYITYCKQDPNDVFPEIKLHGLVRKKGGPIVGISRS